METGDGPEKRGVYLCVSVIIGDALVFSFVLANALPSTILSCLCEVWGHLTIFLDWVFPCLMEGNWRGFCGHHRFHQGGMAFPLEFLGIGFSCLGRFMMNFLNEIWYDFAERVFGGVSIKDETC